MNLNVEKVKIAMARNVMTVTNLAEAYGVSRARMNTILNQRNVSVLCAGRLAKALGVDVTEIID